ncbi:MAG: hypothetical protein DMG09_28210, partial [Acidobacteria bacterium]
QKFACSSDAFAIQNTYTLYVNAFMSPERWKQVQELYHATLEHEPPRRAAFLEEACAGDNELRREVESLLDHQAEGQGFIESPALEVAAQVIAADQAQKQTVSLVGRRIGSYQVLSVLGAGGMGEVYRARDAKLEREVALKVLPEAFALDPERLARFRHEARMVAALNHPNIAAIHGLEESDGVSYLVLELVPGETLGERLAASRLSVEEALRICGQIAEALEAPHEKGIIHRDLKPANIKVTPEGKVKVLDFGLAKAFAGDRAGIDPSRAPAEDRGSTIEGQILGTPAYMSPEQVRGKPLDGRTDIWSFGCVLYETLTGEQAFAGETISDIIAKVLEHPPNWKALPETTPASIRVLLHRCLEKDPHRRLHDIADARIEIGDALTSPAYLADAGRPSVYAAPHRRWWLGIAAVATLLLVAGVAGWLARRTASSAENPLANAQFTRLTNFEGAEHGAAISPDGRWVAFRADRDGPFDVWLSQVGTGRFLNLTQGKVDEEPYPMRMLGFSGDGSEIWLFGPPDRRRRLVPLMGGTSRVFLGEGVIEAAWSADGARLVYHTAEDGDPMFVSDRTGASPSRIFIGPYAGW